MEACHPFYFNGEQTMKTKLAIAILAVAVLSGCAGNPHRNEMAGAATGAVIGGALGSLIGGGSGRMIAIGAGAAIGGAIGAAQGRQYDQNEGYQDYTRNAGEDAAYQRGVADRLRAEQHRREQEAYRRGRMGY